MVQRLNSVMAFDKINPPFTEDDVIKYGLTSDFVDNYNWLDCTSNGKIIKYKITSEIQFLNWLIGKDNLAVKDDWGYMWNGSYWDRVKTKQVFNMSDVSIMFI